jgi:hypothetical protein
MGWFTVYNRKEFDIILGKRWVRDLTGMYPIDHRKNEMWITQRVISCDDRDMAARIHYLRGLCPDSEPDDDTMKEAARTMGIDIIDK